MLSAGITLGKATPGRKGTCLPGKASVWNCRSELSWMHAGVEAHVGKHSMSRLAVEFCDPDDFGDADDHREHQVA